MKNAEHSAIFISIVIFCLKKMVFEKGKYVRNATHCMT